MLSQSVIISRKERMSVAHEHVPTSIEVGLNIRLADREIKLSTPTTQKVYCSIFVEQNVNGVSTLQRRYYMFIIKIEIEKITQWKIWKSFAQTAIHSNIILKAV